MELVGLHFKLEVLESHGLPIMPYPVFPAALDGVLSDDGELPFAQMLFGLQTFSRDGQADWQNLEEATDRLATLLAPEDDRPIVTAAGDTWWLEIGPVNLEDKLVTIQRGDKLIAAIQPREDGRLRIAVFRPLDAKSASPLIALGQLPHPQYGVCMRENNWEYALDLT